MSAYMLLDNAFKQYRQNISEKYGEDVDKELSDDIIKKQFESEDPMFQETLFFEFNSLRFFEANPHTVQSKNANRKIWTINIK